MADQEYEEYKFPDESNEADAAVSEEDNLEAESSNEVPVGDEDFEVEIEDDTPEEDRGREPLPQEMVKELEEDELEDYSTKVKQRLSQMKKVWHDERRAKEAAAREREEAINLAQRIIDENKRLRSTLTSGEAAYIETLKRAASQELEIAKREYKEAYDTADTDKMIAAQERLTSAQLQAQRAFSYQPQYAVQEQEQTALQTPQNEVYSNQQPQVAQPDAKAMAWQERNPWFGEDRVMTSLAWGVHEDLVMSGIDPRSDEYYRRIDNAMRKRFPDYFGVETQDEAKPAPRAKPTVVAPATRSTAPKKVVLTKSQQAIAKRLGLTPKQYALEMTKLENR